MFKFRETISLVVNCASQEEIDTLWSKLTIGDRSPSQCGWLKDRFGPSWQIVPRVAVKLLHDPDPAKAGRVIPAIMQVGKRRPKHTARRKLVDTEGVACTYYRSAADFWS